MHCKGLVAILSLFVPFLNAQSQANCGVVLYYDSDGDGYPSNYWELNESTCQPCCLERLQYDGSICEFIQVGNPFDCNNYILKPGYYVGPNPKYLESDLFSRCSNISNNAAPDTLEWDIDDTDPSIYPGSPVTCADMDPYYFINYKVTCSQRNVTVRPDNRKNKEATFFSFRKWKATFYQTGTNFSFSITDNGNNCINTQLNSGSWKVVISYDETGCTKTIESIVIPDDCGTLVFNDVQIDTTIGELKKVPLKAATVKAFTDGSTEPVETKLTNEKGEAKFTTLDLNTAYRITLDYQDETGKALDVYIKLNYDYFKPRDDPGAIAVPYSMLIQMKQLLKRMANKPNYESQFYLLSFLDWLPDYSRLLQRKTYNTELIDILVKDWQTITKADALNIIERLGRAYISMFSINKFSDQAYNVSKIPPKAIGEFVATFIALYQAANVLTQIQKEPLKWMDEEGILIFSKLFSLVNTYVLQKPLEARVSSMKTADERRLARTVLGALQYLDMAGKRQIDWVALAKEIVNVVVFSDYQDEYFENTQPQIETVYYFAKIEPSEPTPNFNKAAKAVMLDNGTSLVSQCILATEEAIDLANINIESSETLSGVNAAVDLLSTVLALVKRAELAAKLTPYGLLLTGFNAYLFTEALYLGVKRFVDLQIEQQKVPFYSQHAGRHAPQKSVLAKRIGHSQDLSKLEQATNLYNTCLDSVVNAIASGDIKGSATHVSRLIKLDSLLQEEQLNSAKRLISASAFAAENIQGFDSIYNKGYVNTAFDAYASRFSALFNLSVLYLDTTRTTYKDTVKQSLTTAKYNNELLFARLKKLYATIDTVFLPAALSFTNTGGPKFIAPSATVERTFLINNPGDDTARFVYAKIELNNGFTAAVDSIFLGNLPPGQDTSLVFSVQAPALDTFTLFTVEVRAANDISDVHTGFLSNIPDCPTDLVKDSTWQVVCDTAKVNLNELYEGYGLTLKWNTAQPENVVKGAYQLTAYNRQGCRDTALVIISQEIAVWTGTESSFWEDKKNWSPEKVPGTKTHVIIPAGTTFPCTISSNNISVASIQVKENAKFIVSQGKRIEVTANCYPLPTH